jgi:hypothetical protein
MPVILNRLNVPSINLLAMAEQLLRNRLLGLHPGVIAELEAILNARLGQYITLFPLLLVALIHR